MNPQCGEPQRPREAACKRAAATLWMMYDDVLVGLQDPASCIGTYICSSMRRLRETNTYTLYIFFTLECDSGIERLQIDDIH